MKKKKTDTQSVGEQSNPSVNKPPKRKNVSQKIPNGRVLQTRDEYLGEENIDYRKPGYESKGLYRGVVVIDSNRSDELVVVKLTTSGKGIVIETYKNGKSKFKPFVEVQDENCNPIKPGKHFVPKPKKNDLPKKEVTKIKKTVFKEAKTAQTNRKKVRELKGRKMRGK